MPEKIPLGSAAKHYAQAALAAQQEAETTWITDDEGKVVAALVPRDVALRGDWRRIAAPDSRDGLDAIEVEPGREIRHITVGRTYQAGEMVPHPDWRTFASGGAGGGNYASGGNFVGGGGGGGGRSSIGEMQVGETAEFTVNGRRQIYRLDRMENGDTYWTAIT